MIVSPIVISLKVALVSTLITFTFGILLARMFVKYNFKGKSILEVLITLPMVLPPSVTGYALLILIGRRGLIGKYLYDTFGVSLVFTWIAACIASTLVAFPLMYQSAKSAFLNVNPDLENSARTMGADEAAVFLHITLPLALPGIVSGIVLSFARALGEFGATLMVAGNIPEKTETIPLAMYFAVESGNLSTANILMAVVIIFSFSLIYTLNKWLKNRSY
jgi:molybdate transport system permease protein